MAASHHFEEHVGEVAVAISADTLAEVFVEAGRALALLLLGTVPAPSADGPRFTVTVAAPDRPALLVEWLNELIFRADVHHAVFTAFTVQRLTEGELVAEIQGLAEPLLLGQVKAATLHDARLDESARGFAAHVVLDV
jgi:SHS2 domain-containing protein